MIKEFLDTVCNAGVAISNRYTVTFTLPSGVPDTSGIAYYESVSGVIGQLDSLTNTGGRIGKMAASIDFPGTTIATVENISHGHPINMPGLRQASSTLPVTFIVDGEYDSRRFFEAWVNTVTNKRSNTVNYIEEFSSTITITPNNRRGGRIVTIKLYDAWPSSVSPISMAYEQKNTVSVFTVMFESRIALIGG